MKDVEKISFLEEAVDDLEAGKSFYEEKEKGVEIYFATSLLSDISSLSLYAGIHPVHFGYRRMLSKRFPFAVYYDIEGGVPNVVEIR